MGRRRLSWKGGENLWGMLDTNVSGENTGEKVPADHEPEEEGDICGEVRGERFNQEHEDELVEEMEGKCSEEQLLISLTSDRLCLSTSAGAEVLRTHIEELPPIFSFLIPSLLPPRK